MAANREQIWRLLDAIGTGNGQSQRVLANRLGIALGRTNGLVRLLESQRMIDRVREAPARYVLTPRGQAEWNRLSREQLEAIASAYSRARERVRQSLAAWSGSARSSSTASPAHVVLCGTGHLATFAMACIQDLGMVFVGAVADPADQASAIECHRDANGDFVMRFDGTPFDLVVIASVRPSDEIQQALRSRGVPAERAIWV